MTTKFEINKTYKATGNNSFEIRVVKRTACFITFVTSVDGEDSPFGEEKKKVTITNDAESIFEGVYTFSAEAVKEEVIATVEPETTDDVTEKTESQESSQEVAEIILEQIGDNKFMVMTGAYNLASTRNSLSLRFKGSSKYNCLTVTLNDSDLYDVRLLKISRKFEITADQSFPNIYADQLRGLFELETGLATSLTHSYSY